jgi:hypothetical protein
MLKAPWRLLNGSIPSLTNPMAPDDDRAVQARITALMREVDQAAAPPSPPLPEPSASPKLWHARFSLGMAAGLGLALLLGIQLGALPWRFRRELWQAQGALLGLGVGIAIGRLTGPRAAASGSGKDKG